MSKQVRFGLIAAAFFACGFLVAQFSPWQAHGQVTLDKGAQSTHGLILRVRGHDEADFTDKSKKVAIEVWKDAKNNNLIYLTETGSIAVVPGSK